MHPWTTCRMLALERLTLMSDGNPPSLRHDGAGVQQAGLPGHVPDDEKGVCEHPLEAGGGQAAGLGAALPGETSKPPAVTHRPHTHRQHWAPLYYRGTIHIMFYGLTSVVVTV